MDETIYIILFFLPIPFPFLLFERKSPKILAVSIKKRIFAADL